MSAFPLREPCIEALYNAPVAFRYGSNKRRVLVDALTASAILQIFNATNTDNQAKIGRMIRTPHGLSKLADFALSKCTLR